LKNKKGYNNKRTETNTRIKELNSIKELIAKNSYGKANAELIRYMERYPNDMFGIFLYGKLQYKYKELKTAKEAFNRVAQSDSNNKYSAMCVLGNIAADEGDYDTARMHYKKAITESPILEVFAILGWSRMERRIKNVDAALEVLSLKPSNEPRIKLEKVKCLYLQDRLTEARELLDTINHNTQDDFFNRSVILEYARLEKIEGTYESAIKYVEKAKQGPKDFVYVQALYEETKLNIKYGDYKKALELCQELMTMHHPYGDEVFLIRGIIYQGLKQIEKATSDYQIAISSEDLNTKGTASFHLGNIMFAKGEFAKAETLLVDSLEVYGEYFVSGYFKLVSLYIKQERYDEAEILINELVEQFPEITEDISYVLAKRVLDNKRGRTSTDLPYSYVERQIISYDKEFAITHINSRHKDGYDGKTLFTTDKSTRELYDYIQTQMTEDNMIYEDIMDTYSIEYPNIGTTYEGQPLNHIRVVAIPGTKDIITMYPCEDYFLPRKKDYKQEEKPRQMSRVDKFNQKFAASKK
jgi:tetratricopeptide (TPR) repeat protein